MKTNAAHGSHGGDRRATFNRRKVSATSATDTPANFAGLARGVHLTVFVT